MAASPPRPVYSRRLTSRAEILDDLWVYWRSNGREDVSRVQNLSSGGLFLATPNPPPVGTKIELDFLAQEGQIRAEAVVRHIESGGGVGLKLTAVPAEDCPHLAALITRVRSLSRSRAAASS